MEMIVVDDCSNDGTTDEVKQISSAIRLVRNERERLLAGSRNIGVQQATGELLFIVDDDNVVYPDTIGELTRGMLSDPRTGIAGPLMYYLRGRKLIWCAVVKRSYLTSKTTFVARNELDLGQFRDPLESEDFPNAFMVRKEVFDRIGLFDEKHFAIHYDEADFCRRARAAGYKITLIPTAKLAHDIPLPCKYRDQLRVSHVHTGRRAYFAGRNRVVFHKKYSTKLQYLIFAMVFLPLVCVFYVKLILSGSNHSLKERLRIARSYLRGTLDGLHVKLT
jgi:hypothetical protein